jgi:hypothetical protein
MDHPHGMSKEYTAVSATPLRIRIGEMHPDVALGDRTEERIRKRVQYDITVRVRLQPSVVRDSHAAQRDEIALAESMDVKSLANPHQAIPD